MKSIRAFGVLGVWAALASSVVACEDETQAKLEQDKREAAAKAAKAEEEADAKKAEAARELRAADEKAAPARQEARTALQKAIAQADGKVMGIKEKLAKGKAKPAATAASTQYDTLRTTTEHDMEELNIARGAAWDTQKAKLDADVKALSDAAAALEKAAK